MLHRLLRPQHQRQQLRLSSPRLETRVALMELWTAAGALFCDYLLAGERLEASGCWMADPKGKWHRCAE